MEPCKQGATVNRASKLIRIGHVHEIDRFAPIEPTHHCDFALAQRAVPVMPDNQALQPHRDWSSLG